MHINNAEDILSVKHHLHGQNYVFHPISWSGPVWWFNGGSNTSSGVKNVGSGDQDNEANDYVSAAEDRNDSTTTQMEVKNAIDYLKLNKAAGKNGLAAEFIESGLEKLALACTG